MDRTDGGEKEGGGKEEGREGKSDGWRTVSAVLGIKR